MDARVHRLGDLHPSADRERERERASFRLYVLGHFAAGEPTLEYSSLSLLKRNKKKRKKKRVARLPSGHPSEEQRTADNVVRNYEGNGDSGDGWT